MKGRYLKIIKKRSQSTLQLSQFDQPLINNRPVPLHFKRTPTKQIHIPKDENLQLYGCLVPSQMSKMQKNINKKITMLQEHKTQKYIPRQRSSQLFLFQYNQRKQKIKNKEPQFNKSPQIFQFDANVTPITPMIPKKHQRLTLPKAISPYKMHRTIDKQSKSVEKSMPHTKNNSHQNKSQEEVGTLNHWRARLNNDDDLAKGKQILKNVLISNIFLMLFDQFGYIKIIYQNYKMCQCMICDCWWANACGTCAGLHSAYCCISCWLCKPTEMLPFDEDCCHFCVCTGCGENFFCWGCLYCAPDAVQMYSKVLKGEGIQNGVPQQSPATY